MYSSQLRCGIHIDNALFQMDEMQVWENWTWFDVEMKHQGAPLPETYDVDIYPRPTLGHLSFEKIGLSLDRPVNKELVIFNRNRKTGSSLLYSLLWRINKANNFSIGNNRKF